MTQSPGCVAPNALTTSPLTIQYRAIILQKTTEGLIRIKCRSIFSVQNCVEKWCDAETEMARAQFVIDRPGPAIRSTDPWVPGSPSRKMRQLLSNDERNRLAAIASIVRMKKGTAIYREGDRGNAVFNIISGVVKAYKKANDGSEYINAFLLSDDLFGLAEEGKYMNSTKAITAVTAYQIPISPLRSQLSKDAALEFHVICKLCCELRQAERHALLLARKQALPKLVMFLQLLEQRQAARGESMVDIYLPMQRSDIAEYVGMSLAAVSRAFRSLSARHIIETRDRQHVKIIDRRTFDEIASGSR